MLFVRGTRIDIQNALFPVMHAKPAHLEGEDFSASLAQEARACWSRAEEFYRPQHDLALLLEAQSLLTGASPPPLGASGVTSATLASACAKAPAAVTPQPSAASAPLAAGAQVSCGSLAHAASLCSNSIIMQFLYPGSTRRQKASSGSPATGQECAQLLARRLMLFL